MTTFVYSTRCNILETYWQYGKAGIGKATLLSQCQTGAFLLRLRDSMTLSRLLHRFLSEMMSSSALAKHPEILSPLRTKAELKLPALYLLPTSFSINGDGRDFIFLGLSLVSSSFLCGPGLLAYPEVLRHVFFNLEAPSVLVLEMES